MGDEQTCVVGHTFPLGPSLHTGRTAGEWLLPSLVGTVVLHQLGRRKHKKPHQKPHILEKWLSQRAMLASSLCPPFPEDTRLVSTTLRWCSGPCPSPMEL